MEGKIRSVLKNTDRKKDVTKSFVKFGCFDRFLDFDGDIALEVVGDG